MAENNFIKKDTFEIDYEKFFKWDSSTSSLTDLLLMIEAKLENVTGVFE